MESTNNQNAADAKQFVIVLRSKEQPKIAAWIYRRQRKSDGSWELFFVPKRDYTTDNGETFQQALLMRAENAPALAEIAHTAADWINANPHQATPQTPDYRATPNDAAAHR